MAHMSVPEKSEYFETATIKANPLPCFCQMLFFVFCLSVSAFNNEKTSLTCPLLAKRSFTDRIMGIDKSPVADFQKVKIDILALLTKKIPAYPADFNNYGPLFVRLAWHCSGSYRRTDGRGGCDGARIRFSPEAKWPDNAHLPDDAIKLLQPIKSKYGNSLSWGDLIVLTGTTAMESMGLKSIIGFCGGRQDEKDGSDSLILGPSPEQEKIAVCPINGECEEPFGPTTIGLIYVNPGGHLEIPDPKNLVKDIRRSFTTMGMNDRETVALIGGGHAFGKAHGACENPPCGNGVGNNTFTSGFEGQWTDTPTVWTNDFFQNLLEYKFDLVKSPGGKYQWKTKENPNIFMLTSDLALIEDPSYLKLVNEYAKDIKKLEIHFANAWYKLTSQDMGPVTRCKGNLVPPPQSFQNPLPNPPLTPADFDAVKKQVKYILYTDVKFADITVDGKSYLGALFVDLAFQSASTFRLTDYTGGANGARIRFSPESDWPLNNGLDQVILLLKPIKDQNPTLSYADLIILAAQTALEESGVSNLKFTSGRTDAKNGEGSLKYLPRDYYTTPLIAVKDTQQIIGLTAEETVALFGRLRSPGQQKRRKYSGSYTNDIANFSNGFFKTLLAEKWIKMSAYSTVESNAGGNFQHQFFGVSRRRLEEYKAEAKDVYITSYDHALLEDPVYKVIVEKFAKDLGGFKDAFSRAWTRVVDADEFSFTTDKGGALGLVKASDGHGRKEDLFGFLGFFFGFLFFV